MTFSSKEERKVIVKIMMPNNGEQCEPSTYEDIQWLTYRNAGIKTAS